jgi:hypothetical protein
MDVPPLAGRRAVAMIPGAQPNRNHAAAGYCAARAWW